MNKLNKKPVRANKIKIVRQVNFVRKKKSKELLIKKRNIILLQISDIEKIIKGNSGIQPEDIDTIFKDIDLEILRLRLKLLLQDILVCLANKNAYERLEELLFNHFDMLTEREKREIWNQMSEIANDMQRLGCN